MAQIGWHDFAKVEVPVGQITGAEPILEAGKYFFAFLSTMFL